MSVCRSLGLRFCIKPFLDNQQIPPLKGLPLGDWFCLIKSSVFWNVTPCSPMKVNGRFGGTYRLHFQGRWVSQKRNEHELGSKHSSSGWSLHGALALILKMEAICSSKMSVDFHQTSTASYNPATAVKTSNPTWMCLMFRKTNDRNIFGYISIIKSSFDY
jgi:hypothetical protein